MTAWSRPCRLIRQGRVPKFHDVKESREYSAYFGGGGRGCLERRRNAGKTRKPLISLI